MKKETRVGRDEAFAMAPDYVRFVEGDYGDALHIVLATFATLRRGQPVITFSGGVYIRAKVSVVDSDSPRAIDGPVVRVSDGSQSWRVDGDKYAWPVEER